jgi:anti-anti-sigma factor
MTSSYTGPTSSRATVVRATGRLDFHTADELREKLLRLIGGGAVRVVVDLSGVESVDSSGIGALVSAYKAARSDGGDLRLAGPNSGVAAVLEMLNLDKVLLACGSPEDAFPERA